MRSPRIRRRPSRRGATLVEFALVAFLVLVMVFAGIEFSRMVLVYTTVANSARIGARYAIVHGRDRAGGTGIDGESGPTQNPPYVIAQVVDFARVGVLDTTQLAAACGGTSTPGVCVTYPDGANTPGSRVTVTVIYPYDPFFTLLPLRVNLRSTSEGVIVF